MGAFSTREHAGCGVPFSQGRQGMRRELPDAVPPLPPAGDASSGASEGFGDGARMPLADAGLRCGWVAGELPAPDAEGLYVVLFRADGSLQVLAYVDRFARAFSVSEPVATPPACEPALRFSRSDDAGPDGIEEGFVEQLDGKGAVRRVARYRCANGRYLLFDSWYGFDSCADGLSYADAMARCYLAFVHRPACGAAPVPACGLGFIDERLRADEPLAALRGIVEEVRRAQEDPALWPPALARCLVRWLEDAGLDGLAGVAHDALRLVRTTRYANTYYLAPASEDAPVPARAIWALEGALNRYLLIAEVFGEAASFASEADCLRWDAYLIETIALSAPDASRPDAQEGEWALRVGLSAEAECARMPLRFAMGFRADEAAGVAAIEAVAPDAALMPAWRWDDAEGWQRVPQDERRRQALRYAFHLGIVFAAAAFHHARAVDRVDYAVWFFDDKVARTCEVDRVVPPTGRGASARDPEDGAPLPVCRVSFERRRFCCEDAYRAAAAGDPTEFYRWCGALVDEGEGAGGREASAALPEIGIGGDGPFKAVTELPSAALRFDLPEVEDGELPEAVREVLGAEWMHDLRIDFEAARRREAERLADAMTGEPNDAARIRVARAVQEAADDPFVVEACVRVMEALARGDLDAEDQNMVVGCFLGGDECHEALMRLGSSTQDAQTAVRDLREAVDAVERSGRFADSAEVAHRSFDSYAARILHNRARLGTLLAGDPAEGAASAAGAEGAADAAGAAGAAGASPTAFGAGDAGKRIELAPDSLYLCHLELARLLERSFDQVDEALRHAERAVELAPTVPVGYRQLARIHMLVGDMGHAASALVAALRIAVQPDEIAVAYYQLAYALWKAGDARAGAACYLKSIATTPIVALQATMELQELLSEGELRTLSRDEIDRELVRRGIPLAPTEEVRDLLLDAAAASVDAGLFRVARSLLSQHAHYRPDDVLSGVMRSLGTPLD